MNREIFRMERVTYQENGVTFLKDFNLRIDEGEILGLIPVNGYGLNAFLKLLEVNLPLEDGYVYSRGELINSWKDSKRTRSRISVIGAENRLVETLSVTDNIFVLRKGFRQEIIRTRLLHRQLQPFLEDIGMDIPADVPVERLTVFQRVVLELLRAVVFGQKFIVLNEIGALISYEELDKLHEILRHYVAQGFSFLYICLHYEEASRICERCAMMSHGRILKLLPCGSAENAELLYAAEYKKMVRIHMENRQEQLKERHQVFAADHLSGEQIQDLSFSVDEGECLAVQILDNSLFVELRDFLLQEKEPEGGAVLIGARRKRNFSDRRIAVIRELATRTMVFPELSYMENLCISLSMRVPTLWLKKSIRRSIRREYGPILGEEVFDLPISSLTERQKYQMIYTRVQLARPDIIFCIQPFKGADLPHRIHIWQLLEQLMDHGIAVVLVSLNLSDSLSMADRLLVIGKEGIQEVLRKDFPTLAEEVPWMNLV